MNKRTPFAIALIGLLALVAPACGDDDDSPSVAPPTGDNGSVEIDVSMGDIFYDPDRVEIPRGSTLVVNATNDGLIEHDFELDDGQGTGLLDPGESATVEIGPFNENVTAYCTVPGHREAGMEFEIRVT
jgi:nitrite reductase (NO-forming)